MQTYDIRIPVGGAQEINVVGNYVYFLDGSAGGADNTITVRSGNGGDTFILKPGQAVRLGGDINRWIIGNKSGAAPIIGTLLLGDGEFSDNRISGSVEVIDGGKARTFTDSAFSATVGQGAVTAQFAHVQLFNGSTNKRAIISSFVAAISTTGFVDVGWTNQAIGAAVGPARSKRSGGATSVSELRNLSSGTAVDAQGFLFSLPINANTPFKYEFKEPVVIEPGNGLLIRCTAANAQLNSVIEFIEEKI